jgi:hypothetical protein
MNTLLQEDQSRRPELFAWNGPVARERLDEWARQRRLDLPDELLQFWQTTGGGELFESETILGPFGDPQLGDDVDSVNELHRGRGMDSRHLIVHVGSELTAIRLSDKRWVVLDQNTYAELDEYDSFESWYKRVLRAEFAVRYGLSQP